MKVKRIKTYHVRNGKKELNSMSYLATSGNKTFQAYYSIRNGKLCKTSEGSKVGDRWVKTIRYNKNSTEKTNYYYHPSGQLKRWETLASGQYLENILDKNGNIISTETEDSLSFFEKIISSKTNKSCIIQNHYDKYTVPLVEGVEVKIFNGSLVTHLIEFENSLKTYGDIEEIRNHYINFEHVRISDTGYSDFSGVIQNRPGPLSHEETHYFYYKNGNLKKEIKYACSKGRKGEDVKMNKVISEKNYSVKGGMVSHIFENGEITRQEFKYDENDTLIEIRVFRNDTLISVFIREEEIIDNPE